MNMTSIMDDITSFTHLLNSHLPHTSVTEKVSLSPALMPGLALLTTSPQPS